MDDDLDKSFGKLYRGGRQFKRSLLKAVSMQYDRGDTPVWAEDLQFLTACPSEDTTLKPGKGTCSHQTSTTLDHLDHEDFLPATLAKNVNAPEDSAAEQSCHCASYQAFDSASTRHRGDQTLRLTSPGELPGCVHYLAVSYQWPQGKTFEERYDIVLPSN